MINSRLYNQGSAILSALFIMILVAIATTTMTLQLKNSLDATRLLFQTHQLQLDSTITRFWAMDFLSHPKKNTFGHTPGQNIYTQKKIDFPMLPDIHFSAELIDLNARFNLNNLTSTTGKTAFYRLTKHLLEDEDNKKSYPITHALTNWVSHYEPGHEKNNTVFLAHLPIVSLSELLLIPDINPEDLEPLMPYLTALPVQTRVNINTASEELLMAMARGNNAVQYMEELIEARGKKGIKSLADIKPILKKLLIKEDDVSTESEYFLSIGHITKNKITRVLYSLLQRVKNKDNTYTVYLIHETWNTD